MSLRVQREYFPNSRWTTVSPNFKPVIDTVLVISMLALHHSNIYFSFVFIIAQADLNTRKQQRMSVRSLSTRPKDKSTHKTLIDAAGKNGTCIPLTPDLVTLDDGQTRIRNVSLSGNWWLCLTQGFSEYPEMF